MATRVLNLIKENKRIIGFRVICSLKTNFGIHILNLSEAKSFYKTIEKFENVSYIGNGQWEGVECGLSRLPSQDKTGQWIECKELYFVLGKVLDVNKVIQSYKLMDLAGDVSYLDPISTYNIGTSNGFINAKILPKGFNDFSIGLLRSNLPTFTSKTKDILLNNSSHLNGLGKGVLPMDKSVQDSRYAKLSVLFSDKEQGKISDKDIAVEVGASGSNDYSAKIHEYLGEPLTVSDNEILKKLFKVYTGLSSNKVVSNVSNTSVNPSPLITASLSPDIQRMHTLVDELKRASIAYYSNDSEILSNYEYDKKSDELEALEKKTGIVLPDSILHVVAFDVKSKLVKVKHSSKMLSLDKTKDRVDLSNSLGGQAGFLSWKLDGLTVVTHYENGDLVSAVTRGDGNVGEDVLHNVKVSTGVPLKISYKGSLTVRCEAVISYPTFEKINSTITNIDDKYKNPRNLASGSIRQLDSKISSNRGLHLIAFTVVDGFDNLSTYTAKLEELRQLGFDVVPYLKVTKDTTLKAIEHFDGLIKSYSYPTDGLVISIDNIMYGDMLGTTSKFPKNAKAFKWRDETYETTMVSIDWSVGRTGAITPVAVFKPVDIEGSTVSRASLHNVSIFKKLKLGVGDTVSTYKANMIIPQIAENLTMSDTFKVPSTCPVCGTPTRVVSSQNTDVEILVCDNISCAAKHIGGLSHFVERDAMNIEGLSESTIERLVNEGIIHTYKDLYHISAYESKIVKMDGFGKSSYSKLLKAIEKSRECELPSFLYALGVAQMGRTTSKDICKALDYDLDKLMCMSESQLTGIAGIGTKTAKEIVTYFSSNSSMVRELANEMSFKVMPKINRNSPISNLIFCITGDVHIFKNRKDLQNKIESLGGKASSTVSSKTNYLINNDVTSNSNKNQTAKSLNVPIISESDFMKLIGE